jgi:excisionase family DNA binding protein
MESLTLRDRLRRIVEALPPGAAVSLPRDQLAAWVGADEPPPLTDLTVAEAAEILGRRPSTVRGWCASGELRAYRFRSREWRIPHSAIRELQDRQAAPDDDLDDDDGLSGWTEP